MRLKSESTWSSFNPSRNSKTKAISRSDQWFGQRWFYFFNQAQLCGSWKHVSLCDFFPCITILIIASLFSNTYKASLMRRVDVWGNKINIIQIINHYLRLLTFVNRVRWRTSFTFVHQRVSPFFTVRSCVSKKLDGILAHDLWDLIVFSSWQRDSDPW